MEKYQHVNWDCIFVQFVIEYFGYIDRLIGVLQFIEGRSNIRGPSIKNTEGKGEEGFVGPTTRNIRERV